MAPWVWYCISHTAATSITYTLLKLYNLIYLALLHTNTNRQRRNQNHRGRMLPLKRRLKSTSLQPYWAISVLENPKSICELLPICCWTYKSMYLLHYCMYPHCITLSSHENFPLKNSWIDWYHSGTYRIRSRIKAGAMFSWQFQWYRISLENQWFFIYFHV